MERCFNIIPRKSFHPLDFALVCMYVAVELVFVGYAGGLQSRESQNFRCHSTDNVASKETFVEAECLSKYNQSYSPCLPLYQFVLVSFGAVTAVCVLYGFYVRSRVEEMSTIANFDAEDPRPTLIVRTRQVSTSYFLHLFLRFVLTVLSAVLQHKLFYPHEFPTDFRCVRLLPSKSEIADANPTYLLLNPTSVACTNLAASEKTGLVKGIFFTNIGFAIAACVEGIYILYKEWQSKPDYDFLNDSKFIRLYLLNKPNAPAGLPEFEEMRREEIENETETVQPLLPPSLGEDSEKRALDDIYVPLIISTGRAEANEEFERTIRNRDNVGEYQKFPDKSTPIEKLQDLFLPNKDTNDQDPRSILVLGRPGIGKSLMCNKILHDWSKGRILHNTTKAFKYVFLFRFRFFNSEETKNTSLSQLLNNQMPSYAPPDLFQYLLNNSKDILLIFDGLDELKNPEDCTTEGQKSGNGYAEVMSVSALFMKLVQGKFLKDATVLTTTRATGVDSFRGLTFDRKAEIVGFTPQRVAEYVKKFFNQVPETTDKIWNWIKGSGDLLNLCYVPANCSFVCFILKMCTELNKSASDSFNLPTTLTELYQYALRIFLLKHNSLYQETLITMDKIKSHNCLQEMQDTLNRLRKLAHNGMKEKRLIFDLKDIEGIENCGLLHKLPGCYESKFYFFHFTMQEFLAAQHIVALEEEGILTSSKVPDQEWCLVIQFVAGLLKNNYKRGKVFIEQLSQPLLPAFHGGIKGEDNQLIMMKCLHELQNESIAKELACKVQNYISSPTLLTFPKDCAPGDFMAVFYFLKQLQPLQYVVIQSASAISEYVYLELGNLLKYKSPNTLSLNGEVTDKGLKNLLKPMLESRCNLRYPGIAEISVNRCKSLSQHQSTLTNEYYNLTELSLPGNNITANGVSYLGDILTSKYFKVTKLNLAGNNINNEGVLQLQKLITHEYCKLSHLGISRNNISGVCALGNALTHENCKLTELDISQNHISDKGACTLGNALKHINCKLTKLSINSNNIFSEGFVTLSNVLMDKNCKLTQLNISDNNISGESLVTLSNALADKNCKLSEFIISLNDVSDEDVRIFGEALAHKNRKLTYLDVTFQHISMKGIHSLCQALVHANCERTWVTVNNPYFNRWQLMQKLRGIGNVDISPNLSVLWRPDKGRTVHFSSGNL